MYHALHVLDAPVVRHFTFMLAELDSVSYL